MDINFHCFFHFSLSSAYRTEPDDFVVDRVTVTSIIAALKITKRKDGYPAYGYVNYNLNEQGDQICRTSRLNTTHDTCVIKSLRPATNYAVRFRACNYYGYCTAYSRSQTVWTMPISKLWVFYIELLCAPQMACNTSQAVKVPNLNIKQQIWRSRIDLCVNSRFFNVCLLLTEEGCNPSNL